jgi:hypothetical protein
MSDYEEQFRAHLRADLARIAAQIDDLKARIDSESRTLHASLSAEVAALQSDLENLKVEVETAGADARTRHIALQIEELSAKGDAAYHLLQLGGAAHLDPIDAEIRRLEAAAANASGDARAKILARIATLRSTRTAADAQAHTDEWAGYTDDAPR